MNQDQFPSFVEENLRFDQFASYFWNGDSYSYKNRAEKAIDKMNQGDFIQSEGSDCSGTTLISSFFSEATRLSVFDFRLVAASFGFDLSNFADIEIFLNKVNCIKVDNSFS